MASTVPYVPNTTWADGSGGGTPVTAAKLNAIEQGATDAHLMPTVRVTHSAAQSIPNGAHTALQFDTERWDKAGGVASTMHDTVTNNSRLTCRYAGIYHIIGNVQWASNPSQGAIVIRLNGATLLGQSYVLSDQRVMHVSTLYDLAVNDYVELTAYQASGVALSTTKAANYSPEFMMVRAA